MLKDANGAGVDQLQHRDETHSKNEIKRTANVRQELHQRDDNDPLIVLHLLIWPIDGDQHLLLCIVDDLTEKREPESTFLVQS